MLLTIGANYTVVAIPDTGYQFVNIKVNDTPVSQELITEEDGKYYYNFTMIASITKIDATFINTPIEQNVTVGGTDEGSIGEPVQVDGGTMVIQVSNE